MIIDLSEAVSAAHNLLGALLIYEGPEGPVGGRIVETEAYTEDDPAAHTYRGQTLRNAPMFDRAGTIYIYFTYGMHYCMNIVAGPKGRGEAVLIRALEPTQGIDIMRHRRGEGSTDRNLTNGPAKLVQAMGLPPALSGDYLNSSALKLEPGVPPEAITETMRIGIKQGTELVRRFYITGNPYVSKL